MDNTNIKKLNNALYVNKCSLISNSIQDIIDKNGFQVVRLSANKNNKITGKMTMFFNQVFGPGNYSIQH